jgi:hypothetical protein
MDRHAFLFQVLLSDNTLKYKTAYHKSTNTTRFENVMAMGSGGITLYGYVFSKITCTLKYVSFIPPVLLLVDQRSINVVSALPC